MCMSNPKKTTIPQTVGYKVVQLIDACWVTPFKYIPIKKNKFINSLDDSFRADGTRAVYFFTEEKIAREYAKELYNELPQKYAIAKVAISGNVYEGDSDNSYLNFKEKYPKMYTCDRAKVIDIQPLDFSK